MTKVKDMLRTQENAANCRPKRKYSTRISTILKDMEIGEIIQVPMSEKEAHRVRAIACYQKNIGEGDWGVRRAVEGVYRITRYE